MSSLSQKLSFILLFDSRTIFELYKARWNVDVFCQQVAICYIFIMIANKVGIMNTPIKTDSQMDKVLKKALKDPEFLQEILPTFTSFSDYGNIKPYQHYLIPIKEICKKWQRTNKMAVVARYLTEAHIQFCLGKMDNCIKVFSKLDSKRDLKFNLDHYGFAQMLLGVLMRSKGNIDTALVHLLNASESINEHGPFAVTSCFAYYQLAELHLTIKETEDAGKYFKKALSIAQRVKHNVTIARALMGLGSWYHSKNDYRTSINYYNRALKVESTPDAIKLRILGDIGIHYLALKDYEKAFSFLEESYQMAIGAGYLDPASSSLIHQGEAHLELKKPNKALSKLNEALKISLSLKTKAKQMGIETLLASTCEDLNSYEEAYKHLRIAENLRKEVMTEKQNEIFRIKNRMIEQQKETIKLEQARSETLLLKIQSLFWTTCIQGSRK